MERFSRMEGLAVIVRVAIGLLFAYTGAVKLWVSGPDAFATDIANYRVLVDPYNILLGWYLPWLELVVGFLMMGKWWVKPALWLGLAMTGVFLFGIVQGWVRDLDISCGCFGKSDKGIDYPLHTTMLVLLAGVLGWLVKRRGVEVWGGGDLRG